MALIIGLTGGIASGKSTVASLLKKAGITVIDADVESRLAVEKGEEAYDHIVNHFSKNILLKDGSIDRAKLGEIIFNNKEERMKLNEIVHPAVRKRMLQKKEQAENKGEHVIVMDIPLLFESEFTELVDQTLLVFVNEDIQLQRLMERNHYSRQEALARIHSQMPLTEKKRLADAVIDNNGTLEQTKLQLKKVLLEWGFKKEA